MDEVPTDILKNILLNHVITGTVQSSDLTGAGSGYTSTNATNTDGDFLNMYFSTSNGIVFNGVTNVLNPDIAASNGVVHVVDILIELPTVVTLASTNPGFETLVTALTRDDLSEDLVSILSTTNEPAPFTVFAPTNEAFSSLLSELGFESLNDIDTAILESTLATHVVAEANVRFEDLSNGMIITTIGDDLSISVGAGPQLVDLNSRTANIIAVDIQAYNGVIHVIDKVLMPVKEDEVKEDDAKPTCDHVIGLDSTGYAYSPDSLTIKVGETVCWQWTDASDLHNVAEISSEGDQMKKEGGVYSGATATTVDFRYTFTEAMTFHYICEPHVGMQMVGKVIVGDTAAEPEPSTSVTEEEETPGFGLILGVLAVIGIALVSRRL